MKCPFDPRKRNRHNCWSEKARHYAWYRSSFPFRKVIKRRLRNVTLDPCLTMMENVNSTRVVVPRSPSGGRSRVDESGKCRPEELLVQNEPTFPHERMTDEDGLDEHPTAPNSLRQVFGSAPPHTESASHVSPRALCRFVELNLGAC